jgi:ACS family D-galactonate transporter-like MFS transporter
MTAPVQLDRKLSAAQWRVLILLVLSVCINYIDRANLSVAAPFFKRELSLSPEQLGILFSAFFWTYAVFQVVSGWLVDRYNVSLVYGLAFLIWSIATALTGLVSGFGVLLAFRLFLGIGESVAYPAYSKILAGNFPEYHRGLANSLVDAGSKAGPALGMLVGGLLMERFGWRPFFIVLGLGSLFWLGPWVAWAPRHSTITAEHVRDAPGIGAILRRRAAWATFLGLFSANYFLYFLLTWLPSYLVMERHYSIDMMAKWGSVPYWMIAASSIGFGWLSDHLIGSGYSPTRIRKTFAVLGLAFAMLIIPAAVIRDAKLSMMFLLMACLAYGLYTSNNWAITQTLAGPAAAGKWTGLQNGIGNLAGVVSPYMTGLVVNKTGVFFLAFLSTALVALAGAAVLLFMIGPVVPLQWEKKRT